MKNERRKYMNNSKQDILNNLIKEPFINQRILAAQTGHSLGIVNRSLKELISEGYLDEEIRPTEKALREAKEKAPKNAIILAAGFASDDLIPRRSTAASAGSKRGRSGR